MIFLANGKVQFNDVFEMFYHLFTEIGLAIDNNGYLYDQDTGIRLKFKDKYIKATVQPVEIYAGRNDIVFDPVRNYNLMISLLGYYIDKESMSPDGDRIRYIAQYTDMEGMKSGKERDRQRVVIKTAQGDICTNFYYNIYLSYSEAIFNLGGNFAVDLSNFDFLEI